MRRKQQAQLHQPLYTIFKKPSLLKGVHVRHRFEENDELKWYKGVFVLINKQEAIVCYNESDEDFQFSLRRN